MGHAMSFTAKQIDHVEVFVGDIAAAARWYEEVLNRAEAP
jgi:catechol 2,3-dioxygenase-like lactoylglutathione lyase family enzyme